MAKNDLAPSPAPSPPAPPVDPLAGSYKPVRCTNLRDAVAWFGDVMLMPNEPVELSLADWRTRTPTQWGIELANGYWRLGNIPEIDADAVNAAETAELQRKAKADRNRLLAPDVNPNEPPRMLPTVNRSLKG